MGTPRIPWVSTYPPEDSSELMNVTTLIFLGLAVVWAIVLLPELVRKLSGARRSDSIRSFNHQLSVLDRNGSRSPVRPSNVVDLRSRRTAPRPGGNGTSRSVSPATRRRRQEVLGALGAATVLSLVCTVAFGGVFLYLHLLSAALLVAYVVLLVQVTQAPATQRSSASWGPAVTSTDHLRTATVGQARPAPRRIAN